MTTVAAAYTLAAQGFRVFPCVPNGKKPAIDNWPALATTDPAQIGAWWSAKPYNIGIATGAFADDGALLVVDVDGPGHGNGTKDGAAELLRLDLEGKTLPITREHSTISGGRHLIYRVPRAVKQGVDVLAPGLDIRSAGGYIVAPGSRIDGRGYHTDCPAEIAPAPQWLIDACGAPRERAADRTPLQGIDPERARQRAIQYLAFDAERSVKGAGGDQCAYRVAAKLLELGVTREEALDLMLSEHWDDGCGWSPERLAEKVAHAERYMHEPRGAAAPEAVFDAAPSATDEPAIGHPFAELNKQYAFVMAGGGHHILWETTDHKGRPMTEHVKEGTFHKKLAAKTISAGKKAEQLTEAWMASPARRSYDGLVFAPGEAVDARWYNLWRGFDYAPAAAGSERADASVKAWLHHLTANICRGDQALARWLVGYFAHLVQKPNEKPLVALVFKGGKGTGKNAAVERVGALFSANTIIADDDRYLIGNFNSHLEACLLLVLDEAAWAGNKKAESKLKGLITGGSHLIERKGLEPYKVANLTRVVIIGNEEWLVPASEDERRYAVFNVGTGNQKDRAFFKEMREGMEAGGYARLLHFLQHVDISGIDVNDAPKTKGLADQKRESLPALHQWLLDCLLEGQILGGDFAGEWPGRIPTHRFQDASKRYTRDRGVRAWAPTSHAFNRDMKRVFPSWAYAKGNACYDYILPSLADARAAMCAFLGDPTLFDE